MRDREGYGRVPTGTRGGWVRAHRLAWEQHRGPIPEGLYVLHRCDNPPCFRLDHLFLGTIADNNADMVAKGRARRARLTGTANHQVKLSVEDVQLIRRARAAGATLGELAQRFQVSKTHVRRIVNGEQRREG